MNKGVIAAIGVIALMVGAAAVYWGMHGPQPSQSVASADPAPQTSPNRDHRGATTPPNGHDKPESGGSRAAKADQSQQTTKTASSAVVYCAAGHDKRDTEALSEAGGLVGIFQHESALSDAYACAQAYLDHGGDIDAPDSRADSAHLTPLLFAIKRNDPKMVHFMLDHGANPAKRGGPKNIKPYGYAVFSALQHQATNYNEVIGILDSSLHKKSQSSSS